MTVLIVESESPVRRHLAGELREHGLDVVHASTFARAQVLLDREPFALVLLDLELAGGTEATLPGGLLDVHPRPHVIVVSRSTGEEDRIRAFDSGADDYVVKPFFVRELTARVVAAHRRHAGADAPLQIGRIAIDLGGRVATVDGSPVDLTMKEFDLLAYMATRSGHIFTRDQLLRAVWHSASEWQGPATVTEHVRRLRGKIEHDPRRPAVVRTVRGIGYRLDLPDPGANPVLDPVAPASTATTAADHPAVVVDADEIHRALDAGEFEVHYQPIVGLGDGRPRAVEALARWNHPTHGLLDAAAFIGGAERSGAIVELGLFVLGEACRQAAEWRRAGAELELAVNISARQLADPDLVDRVAAGLSRAGLAPRALWLEITETALTGPLEPAAAVLHRLADLGVRTAIDDFGTGWASLLHLRDLPVRGLKVDGTFAGGLPRDPVATAITRSILSLGAELDLPVVAQRIETGAQLEALTALGCSFGQGFLHGRPAPPTAVPVHRPARVWDLPTTPAGGR